MEINQAPSTDLRRILAADQRFGIVNPENDHVWELTTSRGEPPALALQTTLGLRANGLRVFPRFIQNQVVITDPRSFFQTPLIDFSASNFISLNYAPFQEIDVSQKAWVPDSQTLVCEVSLRNTSATIQQIRLEWVVLLKSFSTSSPMSPAQISVNTVLCGQSQNLYPVFFLTGGPQSNLSAYPSLGVEMVLMPNTSRKISWALASLESTEASFYSARKFTAHSLVNEQVRLQMLQKSENIDFCFEKKDWSSRIKRSQERVFQLLMPPFQNLGHTSVVHSRNPDERLTQGTTESQSGVTGEAWSNLDLWLISRSLLPTQPQIVRELIQNLLDWQDEEGTIDVQISWNPKKTGLPAPPMAAALVRDIHKWLPDVLWLKQIYPALLRSVQVWFNQNNDADQDGIPQWRHAIQTGLLEACQTNSKELTLLQFFVEHSEWPLLAALLLQECECLKQIAASIEMSGDLPWLENHISSLRAFLAESWNEPLGRFTLRERTTHLSPVAQVLCAVKQNGNLAIQDRKFELSPISIEITATRKQTDPVTLQLTGKRGRKTVRETLVMDRFSPVDGSAFNFTVSAFTTLAEIDVSGLKKDNQLVLSTMDYSIQFPDFLVPLWAGVCSPAQAEKLIKNNLDQVAQNGIFYPAHLKIMWVEALLAFDRKKEAADFFKAWFLSSPTEDVSNYGRPSSPLELEQLTPILPLLELLGIEKLGEKELLLAGFNLHLPKVNVQYKLVTLTLEAHQTRVERLQGESVDINEPGRHRVRLS